MDIKTSLHLLGLDLEADPAQAKQAYKAQVRRWHPDQFPHDSVAKVGAEEQLKQINIAYARVKEYLARHGPQADPSATEPSPRQDQTAPRPPHQPADKSPKRSWVDHLFDTLNAFVGNRDGATPRPSAGEGQAKRRKPFEAVLDEMAGERVAVKPRRRTGQAAAGRRMAAGYGRRRGRGGKVGSVGPTESPGPVRPVARVRGIGRSR